jgi:hypothetical protein
MNARAHFRVEYPLSERPVFHAPGLVCAVADVSESGMTVAAPIGVRATLRPSDRVAGTIHFRHAPHAEIDGVILRLTEHGAVVHFDVGPVPWATIQAEERALLAKYPR